MVENANEALRFLSEFHSGADLHLTAITPDGPISNRTFTSDQLDEAARFISECNGSRNLYHHVNPLKPGVSSKKAKKDDVLNASWAYVDIDDADGLERLQAFTIPPTVVVASGGGFNAYWKLKAPLDDLHDAESINRWLVEALKGDPAATDVSRILRLPGTINLPTIKKRQRGRQPVQSSVVWEMTDWKRVYPAEAFERVPVSNGANYPIKTSADASGKPIEVCELPLGLDERLTLVAVLGDDPERPRNGPDPRYPSRSEPVFAVACALARKGLEIEKIAGVLMNPKLGISVSILEKPNPASFARQQAQKATLVIGNSWPNGTTKQTNTPIRGFQNTQFAIERLGLICRFDIFRNRVTVSGHELREFAGDFSDAMTLLVRDHIDKKFGFDPGGDMTRDAIVTLSKHNSFDPVCDYLDGLIWDGTPRISIFLSKYVGAEDTPYVQAVSEIIFIGAVKRARQPGVKFDTIPVLEGPQGSGKSTLLKILAGESFFSDNDLLGLNQKEQMEAMEGIWIYEICELAGMRFTEVNKVKAFASRAVDVARPAYARTAERRKRRGILVGTTNDDQYLKDETGNRRFLPVSTGKVDLDGVEAIRDQLWAEASVREAKGESTILPTSLWATAASEQYKRLPTDGWHDVLEGIRGISRNGREQVASAYLLADVLKIHGAQIDHFKTKRLAKVMRALGWTGPVTLTLACGRKVKGYWRLTDRPDEIEDPI
ncbi:MAG: VapE domain-containing protein [Beijerinckiaceae bacterium]